MLLARCSKHWVFIILLNRKSVSMLARLPVHSPFSHVESFGPFDLKYVFANLLTAFLFISTWHLNHRHMKSTVWLTTSPNIPYNSSSRCFGSWKFTGLIPCRSLQHSFGTSSLSSLSVSLSCANSSLYSHGFSGSLSFLSLLTYLTNIF